MQNPSISESKNPKKQVDLSKDSIYKLYFYFFIPNLCAMMALATYTTIDGIFVGKAISDKALAAIGISWPVFPLCIAFELLFGIGAASIASYYLGRNDEQKARVMFSSVCYFAAFVSVAGGIILYFYTPQIVRFLGANNEIAPLAIEYLSYTFLGIFSIVLHPLLDIFVINDKRPILAMSAMIIGSLSNIIFNYIFLFEWELGIKGAAFSTILGHSLGMLILLTHFIFKKGKIYFVAVLNVKNLFASAKNGIPSSFAEVSVAIVMLLFNRKLESLGGSDAIAVYSILLYSSGVLFTFILSTAHGVQPIASFNFGARLMRRVRSVYLFAVVFSSLCGVALVGIFRILDSEIAKLFLKGDSQHLLQPAIEAMGIYFLGFIFLGFNLVSSIFLQSVQRPLSSFIVTIFSELIFIVILLEILSAHFGIMGVWVSFPASFVCACFVTFFVMIYEFKRGVLAKL